VAEFISHSDINLDWYEHPLTGDVPPKTNIAAIQQSIKNIFVLSPYDIPFNANAHSNLKKYLFEPINIITSSNLAKRIEWMIQTYEKRVKLHDVKVEPIDTDDGFNIIVTYKIKALDVEDSVIQFFQRVR
jgi:phage baseplate assembly protein W